MKKSSIIGMIIIAIAIGVIISTYADSSTYGSFSDAKENQNVKLLINSNKKPIILIITKDKKKIFYSAKEKSNVEIYNEIIKKIN